VSVVAVPEFLRSDRPPRSLRDGVLFRSMFRSGTGLAGTLIITLIVLLAFVGPFVAPHALNEVVGTPLMPPSHSHLFGTDILGRDVLSRFLYGGKTLVVISVLATLLAYAVGAWIGLAAGYRRGLLDLAAVGTTDLLLSFPPIVFVLVLLAALGPHLWVVTLGIAVIHVPRVVRIVRAVAIEVSTREFVEAALSQGESVLSILRRDLLPNTWTPMLADFGIRLSGSVWLFASLSFLGLGPAPPASDWGLMISENRIGLMVQPWVVFVPAITIALLTIGVSLLADAVNRNLGRSTLTRGA
jgi:peptide/nickel transport system permease protein